MNIEKLREVQEAMRVTGRVDMDSWIAATGDAEDSCGREGDWCGTAGCVAGWAVMLEPSLSVVRTEGYRHWYVMKSRGSGVRDFEALGRKLLDLTASQAKRLFYTDQWPEEFNTRYYNAPEGCKRAKVVSDRIDHFIQTEGKE